MEPMEVSLARHKILLPFKNRPPISRIENHTLLHANIHSKMASQDMFKRSDFDLFRGRTFKAVGTGLQKRMGIGNMNSMSAFNMARSSTAVSCSFLSFATSMLSECHPNQ
jgi:hypothetical protein